MNVYEGLLSISMLNVKLYNLLGFSHNKLIQYPAAAPTPNTSPVLRRPRSGKALGRLRGERRKLSESSHLFFVMFLMMLAAFVLYGGYLSSPSFSANQVRSLFNTG